MLELRCLEASVRYDLTVNVDADERVLASLLNGAAVVTTTGLTDNGALGSPRSLQRGQSR